MDYIKLTKINFIINLFICLFILVKESIINNPQYLFSSSYLRSIIYRNNDVINIYLSGHHYSENITSGEKINKGQFCTYLVPFILISDKSNNPLYVYSYGRDFLISLSDNNCNYKNIAVSELPKSTSYVGYMNENNFSPLEFYQVSSIESFTPLRCKTLNNEIIIYGKGESTQIIMTFTKNETSLIIKTNCNLEDYIICKRLVSSVYMCVFICDSFINIRVYANQMVGDRNENFCQISEIYKQSITFMSKHTHLRMIDGYKEDEELICAKNTDNQNLECFDIKYYYEEYEEIEEETIDPETNQTIRIIKSNHYNFTLHYEEKIAFSFLFDEKNNDDCVFKKSIDNEFLLCCGGLNIITCIRIDEEYNIINAFYINQENTNAYIDFLVYSSSINLFYFNYNEYLNYNYYNYYEYSIILPKCVDKFYSVIPLGTFNDYLNNIILKETNTNYYVEFLSFPTDYGNLTLNNELIDVNNREKILVKDSHIFEFISLNDEIARDLKIKYLIYIGETFFTECYINFNILECYPSCSSCIKSEEESTSENHNCKPNSCKEYYYTDPDIDTNCWLENEKKSDWYVDYTQNKFFHCNDLCATCDGPSDSDCLSCKLDNNLKYLLNKKCYTECPDGYYPEPSNGYYKCKSCFETCATCSESGPKKCIYCKENCIRFKHNNGYFSCYFEYASENKSFYNPETNEISSCFKEFDYYILANTSECLSHGLVPSEGYYLANSQTGLYNPCHSDCRTCNKAYTNINSNCILCINEDYNFLDGNCLENCPIGYYSLEKSETNTQKKCVPCFRNCLSCIKGEDRNSNRYLTKMNCLECKKQSDPNDNNNLIDIYIQVNDDCFPFDTYLEEKITFSIKEINENIESIKTCLDYGLSILSGTYKCITKPENTYYVLNNEENTGVIKYCNIACATCNGTQDSDTQDTNCIICSEGYFKTEDSESNCILESLIQDNYYKNTLDNIFYKCYPNCQICLRILNHKANSNDMGCISCKTNFFFVDGTNNCFDNSFLLNHIDYYFSSDDDKFHKCYYSCKRCSIGGIDENNQNCNECIDNYYFEINTKNCYNSSYTEQGFYLDTFNLELNELPKFKKCYEKCKTCSNYLINEEMNCISCVTNYYRIIGTTNCITDITIKGYYPKDGLAIPCEENCKTCSNGKTNLFENNINNNNITITTVTNNCLTCDEEKNLYLVENINNCEPENFKNNGFYLQEEPDGTKIFHKCYKSCNLCNTNIENPLTNNENHNCIECAINYYRLLNDINIYNCYGDEMIEKGYRLVRNNWQICHENCGSCDVGPVYNNSNLITQNCKTCYQGFYFIYQTSNCADETYLEKGYYFDDNDHFYKSCDISCISCEKYSTSNDPKCIKCNTEKGYYNAEKRPISNCYNKTTIGKEYTLSQRWDENNNMYKIYAFCYETCFDCSMPGTKEENGCTKCISKYYLIHNTTNCINDTYAKKNGYYFNSTYNEFVKCDIACNNCLKGPTEGNTNCEYCNYNEGYYPIEGKTNSLCYSNETVEEGFFLNQFNEPYKWSYCYENCATCEYKGTANKMNCLSCRTNLKNKFNKNKFFLFMNGNCIESCPNNLFLTKDGDCVSECPSGSYHFQLNYNYSCVEFCPEKYIISSDGKRCELPEFQTYITSSEFKSIISKDITSYVNSSKIINLDNLYAQIVYSNYLNLQYQIKNKIVALNNINKALEDLKNENNIASNESLIIVIIENKENIEKNSNLNKNKDIIILGKDIEIMIYDNSGNKLDLSKCKNEQFSVMKYIGDLPYIDFYKAKDLIEKGIDVFNESDPFFNDICYPFTINSSSDIILEDRRKNLFVNITFCDSGCDYNGIDYELMTVNCLCYLSSINNDNNQENKGIALNNNKNQFPVDLYNNHLIIAKCSNLAFDTKILKSNVGFYLSIFMFSFEITSLLVFVKSGLNPIKNFMLIFEVINAIANPPKLQNLLSLGETNNKNKEKKNIKEEERKKTVLIEDLLNKKTKLIKIPKQINNLDDALVVKYSQSDYEGYENKKELFKEKNNSKNKNNKNNKEIEKKSISDLESNSDSDKEKKTRLSKKLKLRKKHDKRNNFININDEKPKNSLNSKKYTHPLDMEDTLSANKNEKNKNRIESESESIFSGSNRELDKKKIKNKEEDYYDDINKQKKYKRIYNKEKITEKSQKIESKKIIEKNKNNDKQGTIEPQRNKNKKLSINKYNKTNNMITNDELSIMKYEDAIKNDKRSWSTMYLGYLNENNFIIYTFISESFVNLRTIKINFLCFRLEIIFILNAVFYTDSYISKTYYNNGKLDFFNSLPKALYSFLASIFITMFLRLLSINKREIYRCIKEKDEDDDKIEYKEKINIKKT